MATMKDVAHRAGVSLATVSNVVNNNNDEVGYATKEKVLQAIRELNYHPNTNAQSLKTKTTRNIGVIMLHTEPKQLLDPWTSQVVSGIVDVAREMRYSTIIDFVDDLRDEHYNRIFKGNKFDGAIILGAAIADTIGDRLTRDRIAHIVIDRYTEETKTNCVCIDNEGGAVKAVEYLAGLGHRRIAYIGGLIDFAAGRYRETGYRQAMIRLGLEMHEGYIQLGTWTEETGHQALTRLLALTPAPTAVFCGSDRIAFGAMQAARDADVPVPDRLSVMGFDDIIFSSFTSPPLTTLAVPMYSIGRIAANQIIAMSKGKAFFRKEVVGVELIVRGTTKAVV